MDTMNRGPALLDARAATVLVGCCMIWGVGLVMVKIANTGISPVMNAGLRSLLAGIVLVAWAKWRGIALLGRDGTWLAGLLCAVFFALEFITLYLGLALTTVSRGTIFLHCAPFVAALGEHFLVPGHRLSGVRALGLAAAFVGMVIALGEGLGTAGGGALMGDLLCLAGGVFWGLTTVVIKTTPLARAPAEKTLLLQLGFSVPMLLAWSVLSGEAGVTNLSAPVVGALLYTVLLVVVVGYTTWFWLMRTYSVASLHAFTFLTPILGVISGHVLLGERLGMAAFAGLALVALGIYLVNRPSRA
jgi:drug/metabolite transporter (DMT)-like permease